MLDHLDELGNRHSAKQIVRHKSAGVESRLKQHAADGGMADGEFDDVADFWFDEAALDERNEGRPEVGLCNSNPIR